MKTAHAIPSRCLQALPWILVTLTALKMFAVVLANPMIGYANNYDFLRQSSCTGLWNQRPGTPTGSFSIDAPINTLYFSGETRPDTCLLSVDNVFPWLVTLYHARGERVDFREIGCWKTAFILLAVVISLTLVKDIRCKLLVALAFLLVFTDIANLSYLNTLYAETSVITGCFLCLSFAICLMSMHEKPGKPLLAASLCSLLWLGFSKQQYMPLAAVFALLSSIVIYIRWQLPMPTIIFLAATAVVPLTYRHIAFLQSDQLEQRLNLANKTDLLLAAVLPAATDKLQGLSELGLPPSCLAGIGKDWYAPGMAENHPCPAVANTSRLQLAGLFLYDPATFFVPLHRMLLHLYPFHPIGLGQLENPSMTTSPYYLLVRTTSLSTGLAAITERKRSRLRLAHASFGGSLLFAVIWLQQILHKRRHATAKPIIPATLALGGIAACYATVSTVFGDGYCEMQKHAVVFLVGLAFQLSAILTAILAPMLQDFSLDPVSEKN